MAQPSPVYEELNRKWKSTCRVLLGGEVGELDDFSEWLYEYNGPRRVEKSVKSGKAVISYDGKYSKNAKWVSLDEVDFAAKPPAISVNDIKDIDSILRAIPEIIVYAGNMQLGNSTGIEDSTTVMDSHFIYKSESAWTGTKYVAYTTHVIGECVFGGNCVSGNFLIRCNTINSERGFELAKCEVSSDCYYSHGLASCFDCMFSFNLRAKRNCIGNLQLPKERYAQLKQKLVAEMREKLSKDKKLPYVFELFNGMKPAYAPMKAVFASMPKKSVPKTDKSVIEGAFTETAKLIFGVPYAGIDKYAGWLRRNTRWFKEGRSCASGKELLLSDYANFLRFPKDRLLDLEEAEFIGERLALDAKEAETLGLANVPKLLSRIAYFTCDWKSGNNANNIDCPIEYNCTDCYGNMIQLYAKKCAYGWWPRQSECVFGFNRTRFSSFCINTFDSEKIQRCFEVSEARGCSGCYYCHNVENVHDSMFCFNAKNLRYAVGNVELPKEKYLGIKRAVLAQLNDELTKTNAISLSIFNLPDKLAKAR